jgi:hypothetical protein
MAIKAALPVYKATVPGLAPISSKSWAAAARHAVPEPTSLVLFNSGLIGRGMIRPKAAPKIYR